MSKPKTPKAPTPVPTIDAVPAPVGAEVLARIAAAIWEVECGLTALDAAAPRAECRGDDIRTAHWRARSVLGELRLLRDDLRFGDAAERPAPAAALETAAAETAAA